jgi:hypothetical protein
MIINLKAANGLTRPPSLLGCADELIGKVQFAAMHESGIDPGCVKTQ